MNTSDESTLRHREKKTSESSPNGSHKLITVGYNALPQWLRDNEFLKFGHRPPLHTFMECYRSIFRIHTETVNIWTHLFGFVLFIGIAIEFIIKPCLNCQWFDKLPTLAFFIGAIICLGFSWVFHTLKCHSENVGRLFHKLDHCGIAVLIIGSNVPATYYSFYCQLWPKIIYMSFILFLGFVCVAVCLLDQFSTPKYRPVRAAVFIAMGLSGVIPNVHLLLQEGLYRSVHFFSAGWLALMGALYIIGAVIYALRFPERWYPGKFDIWFQSHQIFHVFVVVAALVHFHGVSIATQRRQELGPCTR